MRGATDGAQEDGADRAAASPSESLGRGKLNFDFNCLQRLAAYIRIMHPPSLTISLPFHARFKRYLKMRVCGDDSHHPLPLCVGFVEV
jgi:hypothetical protein